MVAYRIYARLNGLRVRFVIHAKSVKQAMQGARLHPAYRGCLVIGAVQI